MFPEMVDDGTNTLAVEGLHMRKYFGNRLAGDESPGEWRYHTA
jgi:hypothetical protein